MQHDVSATVLDLLAGLRAGRPVPHRGTLWLAPLEGPPGPGWWDDLVPGAGVEILEEEPPSAGRVAVVNRRSRPVAAYPGDLLAGGWADRVVVDASLIPPGARRRLRVEPAEARWWPQGALRPVGAVDPLVILGLELARGGESPGLTAMARTAVWSQTVQASAAVVAAGSPVEPGWVLTDERGVVGAAVLRRAGPLAEVAVAADRHLDRLPPSSPKPVDALLRDLVRAARHGRLAGGATARVADLRARALAVGNQVLGLVVVRVTDDLPGLLLPAA
jgi:hypothetical protein